LAALIFVTACHQDDEPFMPIFFTEQVNFSDLKVGQQSFYRAYQADCSDMNGTFEWTGDTLVLEVTGTASDLILRESFTKGSPIMNGQVIPPPPVEYPVSNIDEGVLLPERSASRLFYFYANDTLRLNPSHDITLQQDECFLTSESGVFVGNDIGYLPLFEVGEVKVAEKTAVSCEPLIELDGYLIHDDEKLYVSHIVDLLDLQSTIRGWHLIED